MEGTQDVKEGWKEQVCQVSGQGVGRAAEGVRQVRPTSWLKSQRPESLECGDRQVGFHIVLKHQDDDEGTGRWASGGWGQDGRR